MEFIKKHWLFLALSVGVIWYFLKHRTTTTTTTTEATNAYGVSQTTIDQMVSAAAGGWPGGVDTATIQPADQDLYPGFYTTADGGYYNPTTGETYSPGSSPTASAWTQAQKEQFEIDRYAAGQAIVDSQALFSATVDTRPRSQKIVY